MMEYPGTNMVQYEFPIRPGMVAKIALPKDLKMTEVMRLRAFMMTLAVDEPPKVCKVCEPVARARE